MRNQTLLSLALALGAAMTSCRSERSGGSAASRSQRPGGPALPETTVVAAATAPVAWLGCQAVGAPCRPLVLIPPGASAHSWEPKPSDLQALQGATLYLRTGLEFEEGWTPRLSSSLPQLAILDLRGGLSLLGPSEHGHGQEADPHVWGSPRAFLVTAETLAVRWAAARPADTARLSRSLPALRARLLALDTLARARLAPFSGRVLLVNHPGLGYLARDYGLSEMPLESHGQEPSPVTLFQVRKVARAQGIRAVFVQPEASRRSAEQVASELGVPVVEVDLLAPGDYDSLFRAVLEKVAGAL